MFVFTLVALLSQVALADGSCDASPENVVRLDGKGQPFSHIPVRNQSDVGTCYANTAVQLVDAWRFKHGGLQTSLGDDQTSDLYAAMDYASSKEIRCPKDVEKILEMDRSERLIEGGWTCNTVNRIYETGSCSQKDFEQWLKKFAGSASLQYGLTKKVENSQSRGEAYLSDVLKFFYQPEVQKSYCLHQYLSLNSRCQTCEMRQLELVGKDFYLMTKDISQSDLFMLSDPVLSRKLLTTSLDMMPVVRSEEELRQKLRNVMTQVEKGPCQPEHRFRYPGAASVPPFHCEEIKANSPDMNERLIKETLVKTLQNGDPVGVDFCGIILWKKTVQRNEMKREKLSSPPEDNRWFKRKTTITKGDWKHPGCGPHAVVAIGFRTCKSGKTQILLRNSWGAGKAYEKQIAEDSEWDNGNQWMDADLLSQNVIGLNILKAGPPPAPKKKPTLP